MITVRFPSGFSVQYNSMYVMKWDNQGMGMTLYESAEKRDSGKGWSVYVPPDCIVELAQPCRTYQAASSLDADRLAAMEKELRGLRRSMKELIKGKL
jgi:hypothetical protein